MRLIVDALACARSGRQLFEGLSFTAGPGDLIAVVGRNGAGKSSLIAILAGLLAPEAGAARLDGAEAETTPGEEAHLLAHRDALKPSLTAGEILAFWREALGRPWRTPEEALEAVGLDGIADIPCGYLSAGQKRRVALARLLVSRRPIWLLDEPTAALDAGAQAMLARLMRVHLEAGGLIVAATHGDLGLAPSATIRIGREDGA